MQNLPSLETPSMPIYPGHLSGKSNMLFAMLALAKEHEKKTGKKIKISLPDGYIFLEKTDC